VYTIHRRLFPPFSAPAFSGPFRVLAQSEAKPEKNQNFMLDIEDGGQYSL
jgi:hypothetical protein